MRYFQFIFLLLSSSASVAQSNCDTLFHEKDKRSYSFQFQDNSCQLFLLDTVFSNSFNGIEVQILNNTADTIKILHYKPSDQPIMWLVGKRQSLIPPDSAFVLQCLYQHNRPGPFHNTISVHYSQNKQDKYLRIPTKGFAIIDGNRPWLESERLKQSEKGNTKEVVGEVKAETISVVEESSLVRESYEPYESIVYSLNELSLSSNRGEKLAEPVGGLKTYEEYIRTNIKWPRGKENGGYGSVYVQFIVEIDGSISNVKIAHDKTGSVELRNEAIRLIEDMPKWIPAKKRVQMLEPMYQMVLKEVRTLNRVAVKFE